MHQRTRNIIGAVLFVGLLAFVLLLVGLKYGFLPNFASTPVYTVTLTNDGFEPQELTVSIGDSVRFVSETGTQFWPASNTHPDHTIYPDFDPKEPIAANEEWTFVFTQPGVWRYHDHINANNIGTITVLDGRGAVEEYGLTLDINECAAYSDYVEKRQCWEGQLETAMEQGGVIGAFAYFEDLYKTEPDVPKECHGWTHVLGKAGYEYYIEHGTIELTESTSHCGYGFYHAYLGELMKYTGDFFEARDFCETITVEGDEWASNSVRTSCKHGLGHGAAAMLVEDPQNYGKFFETSEKAVSICKKIYSAPEDLTECYDGVYNELYQDILNSRYGYTYQEYREKNDPYWHCKQVGSDFKESCYVNVVGILPAVYGDDVIGATQYIIDNTEDLEKRGFRVIAKVAADRIQTTIVNETHEDSIAACNLVPEFLYETCFNGILNGFMQHGEPENLHQKGFAFCAEDGIAEDSKADCYEKLTEHLERSYTPEQMSVACIYASELNISIAHCEPYTSG